MNYGTYQSPIGLLGIKTDDANLLELKFANAAKEPEIITPIIRQTFAWLDHFFTGQKPTLGDLKLAPRGRPYHRQIWELLLQIPYGTTTTYLAIAKEFEKKYHRRTSPRAVGQAIAANPIWLIIPCHRVILASGKIGGYAGGIKNKILLLMHEQNTF